MNPFHFVSAVGLKIRNTLGILFLVLIHATHANGATVLPLVCSASAGCTPDFAISAGGSTTYYDFQTNGNGTGGTLTLVNALSGNITFAYDEVLDRDQQPFLPGDADGNGNVTFNFGTATAQGQTPFSFSLSLDIDENGDVTDGLISLTAFVWDTVHGGFLNNDGTPFNDVVHTLGGVALDGLLLTGNFANAIGGIEFESIRIRGGETTGGIFDGVFGGEISISSELTIDQGGIDADNYLDNNWTAESFTLNVVVPVPAAITFFLPALAGFLGFAHRRRRNVEG